MIAAIPFCACGHAMTEAKHQEAGQTIFYCENCDRPQLDSETRTEQDRSFTREWLKRIREIYSGSAATANPKMTNQKD